MKQHRFSRTSYMKLLRNASLSTSARWPPYAPFSSWPKGGKAENVPFLLIFDSFWSLSWAKITNQLIVVTMKALAWSLVDLCLLPSCQPSLKPFAKTLLRRISWSNSQVGFACRPSSDTYHSCCITNIVVCSSRERCVHNLWSCVSSSVSDVMTKPKIILEKGETLNDTR